MSKFSQHFSETDLELLKRQSALKAELARIEETLKPKISKVVHECGDGELEAYGLRFNLKKTTRIATQWKGIASHYLTEDQINAVLDDYASVSTFCTLKIKGIAQAIDQEKAA